MKEKKYEDLVSKKTGHTRMDSNRDSIIDRVLVNKDARRHLSAKKGHRYLPPDSTDQGPAQWRKTLSDHFPIVFGIKVESKDDDKNTNDNCVSRPETESSKGE